MPDSEIVMLMELNHLYRLPVTPVIIIYTLASFAGYSGRGKKVEDIGVEPMTLCVQGRCSSQLS